jgi:hypothetical protein
MAIELVTGHSGAAHVSGADAGAMHAGICGRDSYVLGAVPSVTMSDANTLVIQPCDLMVEGRHVRLSGTNALPIRSGAQTGKRNDLVYVRYTYDSSTGTESAKLGIKEGTTAATATDPALDNPSSVLDGATIADVAICRVSLDALTPTATWLLPKLPTLGDSVSQSMKFTVEVGKKGEGDTVNVRGYVIGPDSAEPLAVVSLYWRNPSPFTSNAWGSGIPVVTMQGWSCPIDANMLASASTSDEYYQAVNSTIAFRTSTTRSVAAQWHYGVLVFPVQRA